MSRKQLMKKLRTEFREGCLKRDRGVCMSCFEKGTEVHHITDRHEMPNDGYALSNGITLCNSCHIRAEQYHITNGESWEEGFHPDDLYFLMGTTKEEAVRDSRNLSLDSRAPV